MGEVPGSHLKGVVAVACVEVRPAPEDDGCRGEGALESRWTVGVKPQREGDGCGAERCTAGQSAQGEFVREQRSTDLP